MHAPALALLEFSAELVGELLHALDVDLALSVAPPLVDLVVFAAAVAGSDGGDGEKSLDPLVDSLLLLVFGRRARVRVNSSSSSEVQDMVRTYWFSCDLRETQI